MQSLPARLPLFALAVVGEAPAEGMETRPMIVLFDAEGRRGQKDGADAR